MRFTSFPLHGIVFPEDGSSPQCACGGVESCPGPGKHPNWEWSQLKPGQQVKAASGCGTGIVTGEKSGIVVIDLDVKPHKGIDGVESLIAFMGGEPLPETRAVETGSGGLHLYFEYPGFSVRNSASDIAKGVDVRGDGGYVVAPGSPHVNGRPYTLIADVPIAPLPERLLAWFRERSKDRAQSSDPTIGPVSTGTDGEGTTEFGFQALELIVNQISKIEPGFRNEKLFHYCAKVGDLIHAGEVALEDALRAIPLGFADWDHQGKCLDTMRRGIDKGRNKEVPIVVVHGGCKHEHINDRAVYGMSKRGDVYQMGNLLARDSGTKVHLMSHANLREILSSAVEWKQKTPDGYMPIDPPDKFVQEIFDRQEWDGLRPIKGFSSVPVVRENGTISPIRGWDSVTHVYVSESWESRLYPMTVDQAKELIEYMLVDFKFELPAHRSAYLCSLFTPMLFYAFDSAAPIFVGDAPTAGSGKSKLVNLVSLIVTGEMAPTSSFSDNDEEMRKKITAIAKHGKRIVLLDNVKRVIRGEAIEAVLTSRRWSDRLLGGNDIFEGDLTATWYATGNNLTVSEDMVRRSCPYRLQPDTDSPYKRGGFQEPDLEGWVKTNRDVLVSALITIYQEYCKAGKPPPSGNPWGSYVPWYNTVVGCVEWMGWGNPTPAQDALREHATDVDEALSRLLDAIECVRDGKGGTADALVSECYPTGKTFGQPNPGAEKLRKYLDGVFTKGVPSSGQLSRHLSQFRGKMQGAKRLDCVGRIWTVTIRASVP